VCHVDALQGSIDVRSQLHAGAQPQRNLSCGAASLVAVSGDVTSRPQQSSRSRALQAIIALVGRAASAAALNTAHLTVPASTASGENL